MTNRIATFGAGIGYRRPLMNALWADPSRVDVLEILTDGWMAAGGLTDLCELAKTFTVTPHGVSLSLAGPGRPDPAYITRLAEIIDVVGAPYYSEHLAVTEIPGIDTGHLCPPVLSPTSLRQCVGNARTVQSELGVPLAIENITYTIALPSAGLDGPDFFAELVEKADSLILLDVTNLYINSVNHRFDVADYLDPVPLERVVHIHLAGGLTM